MQIDKPTLCIVRNYGEDRHYTKIIVEFKDGYYIDIDGRKWKHARLSNYAN